MQSNSAKQAQTYFDVGLKSSDYYIQDKVQSVWGGIAAERLGLAGEVKRADFVALTENRMPGTHRESLTLRTNTTRLAPVVDEKTGEFVTDPETGKIKMEEVSNRRAGYDFTFSVPKSLSVAMAFMGAEERAKVEDMVERCIREVMAKVEGRLETRVRKGGARDNRCTRNIVFAMFPHGETRPVGGIPDPHHHVHVFVCNATYDEVEGAWKAIDLGEVKADAPFYQAAFDSLLAGRLMGEGYGIRRTQDFFELASVSRELIEKFSRRTMQIEEEARVNHRKLEAKARALMKQTNMAFEDAFAVAKSQIGATKREKKDQCIFKTREDLARYWWEQMTPQEQRSVSLQEIRSVENMNLLEAIEAKERTIGHAFEQVSLKRELHLAAELLKWGVGKVGIAEAEAFPLTDERFFKPKEQENKISTHEVWREERVMIKRAFHGKGRYAPLGGQGRWEIQDERVRASQEQTQAIEFLLRSQDLVVAIQGPAGGGKCLGKGTPVMLASGGVVPVESIKQGDRLMGDDGAFRTVLSTSSGNGRLFKIIPMKGDPWVCNDVHVMTLRYCGRTSRLRRKYIGNGRYVNDPTRPRLGIVRNQVIDIALNEFLEKKNVEGRIDSEWKLMRVGVDWNDNDKSRAFTEDDFRFFGIWLGDGGASCSGINIYNPDRELRDWLRGYAGSKGWQYKETSDGPRCPELQTIRLKAPKEQRLGQCFNTHPLTPALKDFGRNDGENKCIPLWALTCPRPKRLSLLAGLMDTDGHLHHNGYDIVQKSSSLAVGIAFLARSLGLWSEVVECRKGCQTGAIGTYYRQKIGGECDQIPVVIERKKAAPRGQIKDVRSVGWRVEPLGFGDYYGFTLDGNGRFLLGDFTVTHNTSFSTEAVKAIETLSGRKVYAFAPSSSASEELRKVGFTHADTLHKLGTDETLQGEVEGHIIWMDEASFKSVNQMRWMVRFCQRHDCRLILSGDTKQHHGVERGDAMRLLSKSGAVEQAALTEIHRQRVPELKEAVRELSKGTQKGHEAAFDRLDAFGAVEELEDERERAKAIADKHTEALKKGISSLIVAPTHAECRVIAHAVRGRLKEEGVLTGHDFGLTRMARKNLTEAQRRDAVSYEPGDLVEFHRKTGQFQSGQKWRVAGRSPAGQVSLSFEGKEAVLPLDQARKFTVYAEQRIDVCAGDTVRVTKNLRVGKNRFMNNEFVTVAAVDGDKLTFSDGRVMRQGWLHLDQGHCVTSHASQGKTVDSVICSAPVRSFGQVNRAQAYVSLSRARQEMHLFTDSKAALREAVCLPSERLSPYEMIMQSEQRGRSMDRDMEHVIRANEGLQRMHRLEQERVKGIEPA